MAWPQCSETLLSWLSTFFASSILCGLHLDRSKPNGPVQCVIEVVKLRREQMIGPQSNVRHGWQLSSQTQRDRVEGCMT